MSSLSAPMAVVPESLVVLTHDVELLQTLRAVATEHQISTVGAESDLAMHLLDDHAGVAVIDTAAVASPVGQLAERLKTQFPDLVLVVAGNLSDQAALGSQITRGIVYRFLHKPVSEQRVRLFINAAWRRHGVEHAEIVEATASNLRRPVWVPRKPTKKNLTWLAVAAGAVLAGVGVTWLMMREPAEPVTQGSAAAGGKPSGADKTLESLLERADAAFRSNALTAPPAENAVDLYRQAAQRSSEDPRPREGLERVLDRLLTGAEKALLEDRMDEAARLTDIARSVQPGHVRVAFLTTQIGKERERLLLAQARRAAARGKVEEAIAVLDRASLTGGSNSSLADARNELAQKKIDDRVSDFLSRAADRMRKGALVEPAQDNARFFIESARAIAPKDNNIRQAQRALADRIVAQARTAINAGNAEEADRWIAVAGENNVGRDDIATLTRDTQRLRLASRADSMAKLSQAFNQRLAQGRLVDPANDSAKFYLAQLTQTEASHPSTQLARQALQTRLLEEARGSIGRQDYAGARRYMSEAREIGTDEAGIAAIERGITAAQDNAQRATQVITASVLTRIRYVPPEYPERAKGADGWVDILFTVQTDGSVGDLSIVSADPAGVFEQAAVASVRRWRYQPVMRDGKPVEQRAKVRIRFAAQN